MPYVVQEAVRSSQSFAPSPSRSSHQTFQSSNSAVQTTRRNRSAPWGSMSTMVA